VDVDSRATLLDIISLQQANNTAMAERQDKQQERLLTLLENRDRGNSAQTVTVTTVTQSTLPAAGRVTIIPPRNFENLAMAGVSLPPMLRIEGSIPAPDIIIMSSNLDSPITESLEEVFEPPMLHLEGRMTTSNFDKPNLDSSPVLPLDEDVEDNKRLIKYIKRNNIVKMKTGILIKWFLVNRTCINYNIGSCGKTGNHLNTSQQRVLRHICGNCLLHRRVSDSTHSATDCRYKTQSFH
jgi:hypothetical protein